MTKPKWISFAVAVLALSAAAGSEESRATSEAFTIPYAEFRAAAQAYLDAVCPEKQMQSMVRLLQRTVDQKILDTPHLSEDSAMRHIMLDWAAGNEKRIRRKDQKTIVQACFYFIKFVEKGFLMPWQFRQGLDKRACDDILTYLAEETANATKAQGQGTKKESEAKSEVGKEKNGRSKEGEK